MLLAVDPGKGTGIALLYDNGKFGSFETTDLYQAAALVSEWTPTVVICENYILRPTPSALSPAPWSLKAIGAIESECDRLDIPLILQTAGEAKSFGTDEKLKRLGWYKRTKDGHANDAARHLLVYSVRNGVIDLGRLV